MPPLKSKRTPFTRPFSERGGSTRSLRVYSRVNHDLIPTAYASAGFRRGKQLRKPSKQLSSKPVSIDRRQQQATRNIHPDSRRITPAKYSNVYILNSLVRKHTNAVAKVPNRRNKDAAHKHHRPNSLESLQIICLPVPSEMRTSSERSPCSGRAERKESKKRNEDVCSNKTSQPSLEISS